MELACSLKTISLQLISAPLCRVTVFGKLHLTPKTLVFLLRFTLPGFSASFAHSSARIWDEEEGFRIYFVLCFLIACIIVFSEDGSSDEKHLCGERVGNYVFSAFFAHCVEVNGREANIAAFELFCFLPLCTCMDAHIALGNRRVKVILLCDVFPFSNCPIFKTACHFKSVLMLTD